MRLFLGSLEKIYLNGRIQQDTKENRVYTWKKDDRILVSFVSRYHPDGQYLSVQIRDIQLYPQGKALEILYNQIRKRARS